MAKARQLISGFQNKDKRRIEALLVKLLPFFKRNQFAIVGGLAIRYHLISRGFDYPIREFNDLDLTVQNIGSVSPSVVQDFLVYHYHPPKDGNFYLVLVDPETKIKIDIFNQRYDENYARVKFTQYLINIPTIEDQLVKTVYDVSRIDVKDKVDPKQFQDMNLLSKIADLKMANKIWGKYNFAKYPKSLIEAMRRAAKIVQEHPRWVEKHPFRKPLSYKCPQCIDNDKFSLTPMEDIFKLLGYVE